MLVFCFSRSLGPCTGVALSVRSTPAPWGQGFRVCFMALAPGRNSRSFVVIFPQSKREDTENLPRILREAPHPHLQAAAEDSHIVSGLLRVKNLEELAARAPGFYEACPARLKVCHGNVVSLIWFPFHCFVLSYKYTMLRYTIAPNPQLSIMKAL